MTDANKTLLPDNTIMLIGQIYQVQKIQEAKDNPWEHLLVLEAPDKYTSPSTVRLRAEKKLGVKGEEIRQLARAAGYRRMFDKTDRSTGEVTRVTSADGYFTAIED